MYAGQSVEDAVNQMLLAGAGLSEVEAFIEDQPISEDQKSALWLWAWSEQPRIQRERALDRSGRVPVGV